MTRDAMSDPSKRFGEERGQFPSWERWNSHLRDWAVAALTTLPSWKVEGSMTREPAVDTKRKNQQDWLIKSKKFSAFHWFFWFWHPERVSWMEINEKWDNILHTAGPQNYLKLLKILLLGFDHRKDQAVTLSHALSMRRLDVFLDNLLPPTSTQPASKEALNFLNFLQLGRVLRRLAERSKIWYIVEIAD